jgi:hypothetical protein
MLMQSAAVLVIERSNVSRQHDEARGARDMCAIRVTVRLHISSLSMKFEAKRFEF